MKTAPSTRRQFLRTLGGSTAGIGVPFLLPSGLLRGADLPSNRLAIALIGPGNRGWIHLQDLTRRKGIEVVSMCDVDRAHPYHGRGAKGKTADRGLLPGQAFAKKNGSISCGAEKDFRKVCSSSDIDGVVVATPDHWHALICLEALKNGKHVYCEKPVTHRFAEGRILSDAAAKSETAFQVGSQQRSDLRFRRAAEIVRNGVLGKIQRIEVGIPTGHSEPPWPIENATPPSSLDYDFWVGPAEALPFHESRCHWGWRCHTAFGGGVLMDFIGHHLDIAHWSLDMDQSGPTRVHSTGWTQTPYDHWNTPVDFKVRCEYAGGINVSLSNEHTFGGVKWIGENGWLRVKRGSIEASNREWLADKFDRGPIRLQESSDHMENWLETIHGNAKCICTAETGHRSITPGHLAWVSNQTGRALQWDPKSEVIVGDEGADQILKRVDQQGEWTLPA